MAAAELLLLLSSPKEYSGKNYCSKSEVSKRTSIEH